MKQKVKDANEPNVEKHMLFLPSILALYLYLNLIKGDYFIGLFQVRA